MSLKRRLSGEVEIKASASDVHHEIFMSKPHHAAIAAPKFVQGCDLHEGEFGKPGSVIIWSLTIGGKPIKLKNVIEEIDNEKMLVRQRTIEGDLLDEYKTITGICQVIPKDKETSIVNWAFEYEKPHPAVPELSALLDTALAVAQHIDDHHHAQI